MCLKIVSLSPEVAIMVTFPVWISSTITSTLKLSPLPGPWASSDVVIHSYSTTFLSSYLLCTSSQWLEISLSLPVCTIFPCLPLAMSSVCSKFLSISALTQATAEAWNVQQLLCGHTSSQCWASLRQADALLTSLSFSSDVWSLSSDVPSGLSVGSP